MNNFFTQFLTPKTPEQIAEEKKLQVGDIFSQTSSAFGTTDRARYEVMNTDPYTVQYRKDLSSVFRDSDPRLR